MDAWLSFITTLIWQLIVLAVLFYLRVEIAGLLKRIGKVRFGDKAEVTFVDLGKLPIPQSDEKITPKHLALTSSCWRSSEHDAQFGHRVYRFDVIVVAATEVLDRIDRVVYFLPPAWPPTFSPKEVRDRTSNFKLKELAWADVLVKADVYIKDQGDPVALSCFVRLSETGPRL